MSFLYDAVLPGSGLLKGPGHEHGARHLRKSRSQPGLLTSLVQLVKNPARTIYDFAGSSPKDHVSETDTERKQVLYLRMKHAESYEEWRAAAIALDTLEGNDAWKLTNESDEYNVALVAARLEQLDDARISCDVKRMVFLIRTSLTRGLGGMGDLRLYKHSHVGTKVLIERYIESAQKLLTALLDVSVKQGANCPLGPDLLVQQLLLARQSFGRSALLLSGGGTLGMNHIGVVKCLWQARLLPRIISGASAGSIVCAVLCSSTDAEIPKVLGELCLFDLAVFEREGEEENLMKKVTRFLKYGALFDISLLANVIRGLIGDMTFQESYNRTRRILNITVSSASLYELPRLLNYITAPNVMIWSAVCASCSVPFLFSAASILAKDPKTGKAVPWNQTSDASWIDGSVDNDLPMTRLAEMFNVNHFIVSQVNPHVVPFLDKEEGILAQDVQEDSSSMTNFKWLNDIASVARGEALHRLQVLAEMGVFPNYVTKLRSVLNQRYSGDITIFPSISYSHFPRVLRNPTPDYMQECLLTGERATWSKLSRIRNHLAIELALDDAIHQIRARAVFSPLGVPFRQPRLGRPASQGDDGSQQVRKETKRVERDASGPSYFSNSPALTYFSPVARPYLPKRPPKMPMALVDRERRSQPAVQVVSPSGNAGGSSSDDEMSENSDTSYSPKHASPSRWASNRRLFPHASLPSTPSHRASYLRHGTRGYLDFTQSERYQETRNVPPVAISDPDAPSDSQEHVRPSPVLHSATLAPPHRAIDKSVKFTTDTKAPLKERRSPSGPDTDDDVKLEMDLSDFASS